MSESPRPEGKKPMLWRVKKQPDNSIYGPVDKVTLKEWGDSAQISPQDLIDLSDENWRKAPEVEFLAMFWLVKLPGDEDYGPTTLGTLREFIQEGLLSEKSVATHVSTGQVLPIEALLAAVEFEKKRASKRSPRDGKSLTMSLAVNMAKDQRIRQLEADLSELRKEHEGLVHNFRQLALEMQQRAKLDRS